MRIDQSIAGGINTNAARGTDEAEARQGVGRSVASGWADLVEVSEEASDLLALRRLALAAPEVRDEVVGEVKAKLALGDYIVSARAVAECVLEEAGGWERLDCLML